MVNSGALSACVWLLGFLLLLDVRLGDALSCDPSDVRYNGVTRTIFQSSDGRTYVVFSCPQRKELRGVGFKMCVAQAGRWVPLSAPRCADISDCADIPAVEGGILDKGFPYRYRDVVTLSCDPGHLLIGEESTRCLLRGWSKTLGTCRKFCAVPKVESTVTVLQVGSGSDTGTMFEGERLGFECKGADFGLSHTNDLTCLGDGSLTGTVPTCRQRFCKGCVSPASDCRNNVLRNVIESGAFISSAKFRYLMNDKIRISCPRGFSIEPGTASVYTCRPKTPPENGKQILVKNHERDSQCVRSGCFPPDGWSSSGGVLVNPSRELYILHESVHFDCGLNIVLGSNSSQCQSDGSWSLPWPSCYVRKCQRPDTSDGRQLIPSMTDYPIGNTVLIKCPDCMRSVGQALHACRVKNSRAQWLPPVSQTRCQRTTCPAPLDGVHPYDPLLEIEGSNRETDCGTSVSFRCAEGYSLVGRQSIQCMPNGEWSDCPPLCVRQQCTLRRHDVCTGYSQCMRNSSSGHSCDCLPLTAQDHCQYNKVVCANNGKTYQSEYRMNVENCRSSTELNVVGTRGEPCQHDGVCHLPVPSPPQGQTCIGGVTRYHFNNTAGKCTSYIHSYCTKGLNSFTSAIACRKHCERDDKCAVPKRRGQCIHSNNQAVRYSFDKASNGVRPCKPFYYLGCHGNENNFPDEATCTKWCVNRRWYERTPCFGQACPEVRLSDACYRQDNKTAFIMIARIIGKQHRIDLKAKVKEFRVGIEQFATGFLKENNFNTHLLRVGVSPCACPDLERGRFLIVGYIKDRALFADSTSFVLQNPDQHTEALVEQECPYLQFRPRSGEM